MTYKAVKIVVYVPLSHADEIRRVLSCAGASHIGNYDCCSFSVKGVGRFRGLQGTHPYIGHPGKIEKVEEERIETVCPYEKMDSVLSALKKAHPYEEPAIDVFPLLNL